MLNGRRPWQEELEIIDRTMKAISGVTDPEELVDVYWAGIGDLLPIGDYVALSRRNVEAPYFLITRSSLFTEHPNPWTQRDQLPRLSGGILGEIAYANRPVIIEDIPAVLKPDDPGHFYLHRFKSLLALPQYDSGEGLNITVMLMPGEFDIDRSMIPMLHWQAGLFGRGTQNLVLKNQLSTALTNLDRELQTVGEIQRSLLPSKLPEIPGFDLAAFYQTSARAGGDYYDFFPLERGRWGLFIADVSGHGTPAAVLMAITHAVAHAQPGRHIPPPALLTYLNNQLSKSYTRAGTFVTAFYAVLDPADGALTYSAAGHNPPRLARGGKVIALDEAGSIPLGITADHAYTASSVRIEPGDLLLLYTDGITESMARGGRASPELFGTERLDRVLVDGPDREPGPVIERIKEAIRGFTSGAAPTDDQTLIAIRCRGPGQSA